MRGDPALQHLMSIHFTWQQLGQVLLSRGRGGMLYFVFNRQVVAVVVAHDLSRGEFVAQVGCQAGVISGIKAAKRMPPAAD